MEIVEEEDHLKVDDLTPFLQTFKLPELATQFQFYGLQKKQDIFLIPIHQLQLLFDNKEVLKTQLQRLRFKKLIQYLESLKSSQQHEDVIFSTPPNIIETPTTPFHQESQSNSNNLERYVEEIKEENHSQSTKNEDIDEREQGTIHLLGMKERIDKHELQSQNIDIDELYGPFGPPISELSLEDTEREIEWIRDAIAQLNTVGQMFPKTRNRIKKAVDELKSRYFELRDHLRSKPLSKPDTPETDNKIKKEDSGKKKTKKEVHFKKTDEGHILVNYDLMSLRGRLRVTTGRKKTGR